MIKRKIILLAAASALSSFSFCQSKKPAKEELFKSVTFTKEGSFTAGAEGPAVDQTGMLYAVNLGKEGTIGSVTPTGEGEVFVTLPEGSVGNGIRFDSKGAMYIADYPKHNVLKVDMTTKTISVYAHDDAMNQPNDLAMGNNDLIYASDPNWKESTGKLWRVDRDGQLTLLEDRMGTTNGVEVSPDGKKLYVAESVQRVVWVYDLSPEGNVSNKKQLITFPDFGMDGMRCDVAGNLYITRHGKGTVAKVSPQGKVLVEVNLIGKKPSNIAFGGPDGRTAYVTLQDRGCIESFWVDKPGNEWKRMHGKK